MKTTIDGHYVALSMNDDSVSNIRNRSDNRTIVDDFHYISIKFAGLHIARRCLQLPKIDKH
ncbi:hypothetical protein [Maribacter algicola]|uniref:hypothetical protein n=1 Tax=Maribacter algicola TaxID=2498892 RepID=UPI000F64980D|nr:hypothetical protein [Maribacter algicola]